MNCKNCGVDLPRESLFCNICGYKVLLEEDRNSRTKIEYLSTVKFEDINETKIGSTNETVNYILEDNNSKGDSSKVRKRTKLIWIVGIVFYIIGITILANVNTRYSYTTNTSALVTNISPAKDVSASILKDFNTKMSACEKIITNSVPINENTESTINDFEKSKYTDMPQFESEFVPFLQDKAQGALETICDKDYISKLQYVIAGLKGTSFFDMDLADLNDRLIYQYNFVIKSSIKL